MTTRHLRLSIEGFLSRKHRLSDYKDLFFDGKGNFLSPHEAKTLLRYELAMGKKCLPIGDCDNFDFQTGCRGHDDKPK